jgi:hypothetical protein
MDDPAQQMGSAEQEDGTASDKADPAAASIR